MSKSRKTKKTDRTIALTGSIGPGECEALWQTLTEAMASGDPLVIDMTEVETCGTMAAQLLWSATKTAARRSIPCEVRGDVWATTCERVGLPDADLAMMTFLGE